MQVTAIHDGMAFRQLDGFVRNAPLDDVKKALADNFLPTDRFPITFTTLVINTGSKLVLIDTGNGDLGAPTAGTWMTNFRAAGFTPEMVDTVVFSHFHGDHINGLRRKDGTAVFPSAQIMVPEPEWAWWTNENEASRADGNLKPTFDNTKRVFGPVMKDVTTYAWDKEILPGITSVQANGHTPGHTAFAIVSQRPEAAGALGHDEQSADLRAQPGVVRRGGPGRPAGDRLPASASWTSRPPSACRSRSTTRPSPPPGSSSASAPATASLR